MTPSTPETETKDRSSAKRQRNTRSSVSAQSVVLSDSKNPLQSHLSATKSEKQPSHSKSKKSVKDSVSSSAKHKKKTERSKKLSLSVEESDDSFKRTKRKKKWSKEEAEVSEGEFERHGRRVAGISVICDPPVLKGKGKSSTPKSAKGKGRARTEVSRY